MPRLHGRSIAATIRAASEDLAAAVRARDVERLMSHYAPDVRFFGLASPLESVGSDALRAQAEDWLASYEGPIGHEVHDLAITARGDVAFRHGLNRVHGTRTDGTKVDMWWRSTLGYRKTAGRWLITHRHDSVPVDMKTGKAAVDLTP